MERVRIDKWLWAARFFKTRAIAKAAIEGGKVHWNGQRVKPAKEILVGCSLRIRQGFDEKTVEVIALNDQRRPAAEAQLLYKETDASVEQRAQNAAQRRAMRAADAGPHQRPTKKQRRHIIQFKQDHLND